MERFKSFWLTIPTPQKAIAIIFILVVVGLLIGGAGGLVSKYKDSRFDKREAEREEQRQVLEDERNVAIGKALAAEEQARKLELNVRVLEVTVDAFGRKAEKIQEVIKDEEAKMVDEGSAIDIDIPECERLNRICARLKNLGYLPKAHTCPKCQ